jgi:hypothetical protein
MSAVGAGCQQGRAAGRRGRGAGVTDRRDRGEAGPGGSGWGVIVRKRERHGGGGAPTYGPRRHSAGRRRSNWN